MKLTITLIIFLPLELGVTYYLTKNRFRPLIGLGNGIVIANSRYALAKGNINSGINTLEEYEFNDRVLFGKISTGFDYRLGKGANFSLNLSYYFSGKFEESIGGYGSYNGILVKTGLSILL
jgi:outer membrane protein W